MGNGASTSKYSTEEIFLMWQVAFSSQDCSKLKQRLDESKIKVQRNMGSGISTDYKDNKLNDYEFQERESLLLKYLIDAFGSKNLYEALASGDFEKKDAPLTKTLAVVFTNFGFKDVDAALAGLKCYALFMREPKYEAMRKLKINFLETVLGFIKTYVDLWSIPEKTYKHTELYLDVMLTMFVWHFLEKSIPTKENGNPEGWSIKYVEESTALISEEFILEKQALFELLKDESTHFEWMFNLRYHAFKKGFSSENKEKSTF